MVMRRRMMMMKTTTTVMMPADLGSDLDVELGEANREDDDQELEHVEVKVLKIRLGRVARGAAPGDVPVDHVLVLRAGVRVTRKFLGRLNLPDLPRQTIVIRYW
jgi:hypothetical protein